MKLRPNHKDREIWSSKLEKAEKCSSVQNTHYQTWHITAFLADDIHVPGERTVPKAVLTRAVVSHQSRGLQESQRIAKIQDNILFQPIYRRPMGHKNLM